ncbi:hypothetical protein CBR_g31015 [Chara braunii]|uniref:Uncharacterized protein n=1 Tax=Chara braunii TaxID=69332 RepID=A0A388LE24_CHABU|nr:hypothetical protein CBR_g31015 [Chara braunii]|eukprot:GBG80555.1 hypothetical protein CBR_g31015 [Chara braunii]
MLDDESSLMWHIKPGWNRILLLVVPRQRPVIISAHQVAGEKSVVGGSIYEVPRPVMRQPQFVVVPPTGAGPSTMPRPTRQPFSPMFGMPPPGGVGVASGPVQRVSAVPSTTVVTTVPLSSQTQVSVQQPVSVAIQSLQQAPGPMQPMQWMPKIPLMSPKPFFGDRKKEEDLDTWVRTVPTYVRHKLTRPEQEVVVAASFLEGSAARWLNGLVQQQGYGQDFDAWAQAQTLEQFVRSVYNRWHDPQGAQKATDAINNLCARRFKDVRELTDTIERLLMVPGVRFDQQVLLTDYLRCLPAEVRTKLVDEAYVEQHAFATFSKKALDIEAKLGSAHKASHDGRKRLPQDWKKKGQLMFVDHDGQTAEIDDFPDLGELTEQDGASETSDGGVVAPIKEKARGTGKKKVVRSTGQGDQGTPACVKIGLDYEVWRDRVARGTCMNCGNYGHTMVEPKKEKLHQAEQEYAAVMSTLSQKQDRLKAVESHLNLLNETLRYMQQQKENLEQQVASCTKKLTVAQRLLAGLGDEKIRWRAAAAELKDKLDHLAGDLMLSAGIIAYLGPLTLPYRSACVDTWRADCAERGVICSSSFSLSSVLSNHFQHRDWAKQGLPRDGISVDNAIAIAHSRRFPLMIDPQGQASAWVKRMEKDHNLVVLRPSDATYMRSLETCVQFGRPVLLENVGEDVDPGIEPLLLRQTYWENGALCIHLGDSSIPFSTSFRLFITTRLRNPHISPELSTKAVAEEMERKIDAARACYAPVAKRAALYYFCVMDLAGIDPMYQFSLSWYYEDGAGAMAPQISGVDAFKSAPEIHRVSSQSHALNVTLYCRGLLPYLRLEMTRSTS